ncbi:secretin receptor-like [Tubulanus polymorphus]|uniref:secretin receptor-like n=1 Tax=Tubulanus polymorphus TaxID=672921 RepID=UPI003DA3A91C
MESFDINTNQTGVSSLITEHMKYLTIMYSVGYTVSLVSLITAVFIMTVFRRLHCARNTIHINMFVSFILRAAMSLMKDTLLVDKLGFPSDVRRVEDGRLEFLENSSHWECKLFFTCFHYTLNANYAWVFVEGLYLYMLIHVAVFTENSSVKWFILGGWGSPFISILPWTIVRATLDDTYCWNINTVKEYFWILKLPIILLIVTNFGFFISIIWVLFTKLVASNAQEARKYRYKKLAKSTLVLIPLFGVHYILFIWLPEEGMNDMAELVKLYYEMFFNSFQGFFISLLFCFLNGEVRGEIRKKWERYWLQRTGGAANSSRSSSLRFGQTMTSYVPARGRSSVHSSNGEKIDHVGLNGHHLSDMKLSGEVLCDRLKPMKPPAEGACSNTLLAPESCDSEESKLMLDAETRNL